MLLFVLRDDCNTILRDKVVARNIRCCFCISRNDNISFLQIISEAMVVPMNLEPIVLVVPFLKVADVCYLDHKLACMLVPISLHLANVSRKDMLFSDFSLSLHPDCLGGGIGRHAGL